MHPVYILALVTLLAVFAFGVWNYMSTRQHQKTGGNTTGIGGPNDPLSGAGADVRHPDQMRASLDAAPTDLSNRG